MTIRSSLAMLVVTSIAFVTLPMTSMAIGLGANVGYSYRTATLNQDSHGSPAYPQSLNWSSNDLRVGLSLDTAVARDRLFNYRLNLNYQRAWISLSTLPNTFNYDGGEMENIFGFGVVRKPEIRWWVGPALRISGGVDPIMTSASGSPVIRNASEIEVGAGLVGGVNMHRGDRMSVSLTTAYYINWSHFQIDDDTLSFFEPQYGGPMHRISVGLTLLYRLGDDRF